MLMHTHPTIDAQDTAKGPMTITSIRPIPGCCWLDGRCYILNFFDLYFHAVSVGPQEHRIAAAATCILLFLVSRPHAEVVIRLPIFLYSLPGRLPPHTSTWQQGIQNAS